MKRLLMLSALSLCAASVLSAQEVTVVEQPQVAPVVENLEVVPPAEAPVAEPAQEAPAAPVSQVTVYNTHYATGSVLTYSVSTEESLEKVTYTEKDAVQLDVEYNTASQRLVFRTFDNNDYSIVDGSFTLNQPLRVIVGGKVYDYKVVDAKCDELGVPLTPEQWRAFVSVQEDNQVAVAYEKLNIEPLVVMQYVEMSKVQKVFVGRELRIAMPLAPASQSLCLLASVEGDDNTGVLKYEDKEVKFVAHYTDGVCTHFEGAWSAENASYVGAVAEVDGVVVPAKGLYKKLGANAEVVYNGEFVNCNYEGVGALTVKSGAATIEYEGDFRGGIYEGKGLYREYNGANCLVEYSGDFVNSLFEGVGSLYRKGEMGPEVYQGEFKAALFHGNGELKREIEDGAYSVTITRSGQFVDGKFEKGSLVASNRDYVIKVLSPYKVKVLLGNGDVYVGEPIPYVKRCFKHDEYKLRTSTRDAVKGIYKADNGNIFKGVFSLKVSGQDKQQEAFASMGQRLLKGFVVVNTSKGRYAGQVVDGRLSGRGKMTLRNGNSYEGTFVEGELDTYSPYKVRVKMESGDRYDGAALKGKLNGLGYLRCANGDYYKGEFKNDKFMGAGVVRFTTKKGVVEGVVSNYKCQKDGSTKKAPKYKASLPNEAVKVGSILY